MTEEIEVAKKAVLAALSAAGFGQKEGERVALIDAIDALIRVRIAEGSARAGAGDEPNSFEPA